MIEYSDESTNKDIVNRILSNYGMKKKKDLITMPLVSSKN